MFAASAARNFTVSSIASLSSAKLCLIGTVNRVSLTNNRLPVLNPITVAASATVCVSPDQPRVIVAGNGPAALIAVGGKKLVFRNSQILADSPKKFIMFDLKNGVSDMLQLAAPIIDFHLNISHLV
jgi:hypothetical protein